MALGCRKHELMTRRQDQVFRGPGGGRPNEVPGVFLTSSKLKRGQAMEEDGMRALKPGAFARWGGCRGGEEVTRVFHQLKLKHNHKIYFLT